MPPHVHIKGSGLGLGAINAVCENVNVNSSIIGKLYKQSFGKSEILSDKFIAFAPSALSNARSALPFS